MNPKMNDDPTIEWAANDETNYPGHEGIEF